MSGYIQLGYDPTMRTPLDLTGIRFGMGIAIKRAPDRIRGNIKQVVWECLCDCGTIYQTATHELRKGDTRSCGCFRKLQAKILNSTHGKTHTREFKIWQNMLQRCNNPNNERYKNYGGRGIRISAQLKTFEGFLEVLGECPKGMSLDRIDVNGDYESGNVRWIPLSEQASNTTRSKFLSFRGRTLTLSQWSRATGINPQTISKRVAKGWPVEKVLS